jgi:hypothetical protein
VADPEDLGERLVQALSLLDEVADTMTPDEAAHRLDDASLQMFWRDWPNLSSWAGALWRQLDGDLSEPARPPRDPELDEVGGSG